MQSYMNKAKKELKKAISVAQYKNILNLLIKLCYSFWQAVSLLHVSPLALRVDRRFLFKLVSSKIHQ